MLFRHPTLFLLLLVLGFFTLFPALAFAGPITDLVESLSPGLTGTAWWGEALAAIVALSALATSVMPQGDNVVRRVLDWVALNVGNAKNL